MEKKQKFLILTFVWAIILIVTYFLLPGTEGFPENFSPVDYRIIVILALLMGYFASLILVFLEKHWLYYSEKQRVVKGKKKLIFWYLIVPLIIWVIISIVVFSYPLPESDDSPIEGAPDMNEMAKGARNLFVVIIFCGVIVIGPLFMWIEIHKQKQLESMERKDSFKK
jgi:membrane protease YdiL (CAAX protease family)